jgi:predicted ATPase
VYLIEEPENGIHPRGIQAVYDSLSSVYEGQVLVATHSPLILNLANYWEILCFTKSERTTEIISGPNHPGLLDWKGEVKLGSLLAGGVFG